MWNKKRGKENEIIIYSLFSWHSDEQFDIIATISLETNTIQLRHQIGEINAPTYHFPAELHVYLPNYETNKYEEVEEIIGQITEDGSFDFGECMISLERGPQSGIFYAWYNLKLDTLPIFEYNAEEWEHKGKVKFIDGWYAPAVESDPKLSDEVPTVWLDYYTSRTEEGVYAFENPYKDSFWESIQEGSREGWIVVDASDRDFVRVRPWVENGFYSVNGFDETYRMCAIDSNGFYNCIYNWDKESLMEYYEDVSNNADEAKEYCSTFEDNKIILRKTLFCNAVSGPISAWYFNSPSGKRYHSVFEFPTTGIESIASEGDESVRYFNLQGLEIAHPAKGEIVIRRQGNHSQKVIY